MTNTLALQLTEIRLDGGTQCRASLDSEWAAEIAGAWIGGAKIPPVDVFHDGNNYWLADGFHRYHAAQRAELRDVLAIVHSGTRLDAVRFSLKANATHGQRRTNADKRRAVEVALKEFGNLSDRQIAELCAVGHQLVGNVRAELDDSSSSQPPPVASSPTEPPAAPPPPAPTETRIGADGKARRVPKKRATKGAALMKTHAKDGRRSAIVKEAVTDRQKSITEAALRQIAIWSGQADSLAIAIQEKNVESGLCVMTAEFADDCIASIERGIAALSALKTFIKSHEYKT